MFDIKYLPWFCGEKSCESKEKCLLYRDNIDPDIIKKKRRARFLAPVREQLEECPVYTPMKKKLLRRKGEGKKKILKRSKR